MCVSKDILELDKLKKKIIRCVDFETVRKHLKSFVQLFRKIHSLFKYWLMKIILNDFYIYHNLAIISKGRLRKRKAL